MSVYDIFEKAGLFPELFAMDREDQRELRRLFQEARGKGVHHFVVNDGLEVSFDLYWDSGYWAEHCKI